MEKLLLTEAREDDLDFLLGLWNDPRVMRYAGYPDGRCWSRADIRKWWSRYQAEHTRWAGDDVQFIISFSDGTHIGESHYGPVPKGFEVGDWRNPEGVYCFMADIKLLPEHWGKGFGTAGMRMVAVHIFTKTSCKLLVVPPHKDNPAASRVYEKAGFIHTGIEAWPGHEIMELSRERFEDIYGVKQAEG
ncbi:GNAT family N-acetyltransferase [candidate division WOR-3 bacterium]|nr:GNAT family N-acetyltransferase [candidate division WOR-3 bacterium]